MERRALIAPGRVAACLAVCLVVQAPTLLAQQAGSATWQVRGLVVDEQGAPLAGAAIGVVASGTDLDTKALLQAPAVQSDEHGRYTIDVTAAGSWPSLVIAARDRQTCTIRLGTRPAQGEQQLVDAVLVPGVQLIGRVRAPDGTGLRGAHVAVESSVRNAANGSLSLRSGAFVNARGIFVVPAVPRSGLRVTIRCAGYLGCTLLAAHGSPLDVTLQPAAVVRGRVLDQHGAPVADAPVTRTMVASSPPLMPCRTDADGRFAIDVPPDVLLRLKVSVDGRSHVSDLLRGAHDDVLLTEVTTASPQARLVKLSVRDAASGETLPKVHVSQLMFGSNQVVTALFHRHDPGADFAGDAAVPLQGNTRCLLVEAPGHGFELVDIDADAADGDGDQPLVVSLGPEAVIAGVVTDSETGQPLAGVHVRALPKGNSSGSGGRLDGLAPVSDAQGRYRVEGLRPGEYTVQVHAADRTASQPEAVDLTELRAHTLDLAVPARTWLRVQVEGELGSGPWPQLRGDALRAEGGGNGFFQHHVAPPAAMTVRAPGTLRLGPVAGLRGELLVAVPSRLRGDAASLLALPVGDEGAQLDLAQLRCVLLTGRVEAADLPAARVAVVAERVGDGARRSATTSEMAGLEAGGQFALDLLPGTYQLSLIDLETNLEFHREAEELQVSANTPPPVLRPQLHWLAVELAAEPADGELLLQSLRVGIQPFDAVGGGGRSASSGTVAVLPGVRSVRLLVPTGEATLAASRALARLGRATGSYRYEDAGEQKVTIEQPETTVTLRVPAPPSDDELRREYGQ